MRRPTRLMLAAVCAAWLVGSSVPGGALASSERAPRPIRFTVLASGDLLAHSPVVARARALAHGHGYDFRPMLRAIRPLVRHAEKAICHAETPITPGPPTGYPLFSAPTALATAIRSTGWDACSTASNHSLDKGQSGIDRTAAALDRVRVGHTGSFRSAAERRRTPMFTVKGVKVAFLAYTEMTNGIPLPHSWSVNLARGARILADARRARRRGARVVIVNIHWGDEYHHAPSAFQRRLADRLTRSPDITAILGQHVHVVQPIRRINGKLVVFGEGNLLSNQSGACCPVASQDGMMVLLRFVVDRRGARVRRVDYVPTYVRHPSFTVLPATRALVRGRPGTRALRASYRRTVSVVGRQASVAPIPRHLPGG